MYYYLQGWEHYNLVAMLNLVSDYLGTSLLNVLSWQFLKLVLFSSLHLLPLLSITSSPVGVIGVGKNGVHLTSVIWLSAQSTVQLHLLLFHDICPLLSWFLYLIFFCWIIFSVHSLLHGSSYISPWSPHDGLFFQEAIHMSCLW